MTLQEKKVEYKKISMIRIFVDGKTLSKIFLLRQSETTNYPTTNEKQIKVKDARQKPRVKMKLFRENSFFQFFNFTFLDKLRNFRDEFRKKTIKKSKLKN